MHVQFMKLLDFTPMENIKQIRKKIVNIDRKNEYSQFKNRLFNNFLKLVDISIIEKI